MQRIGNDGRRRVILCSIIVAILALTIVLDLITKVHFAKLAKQATGYLYIPVIEGFFYFTFTENTGAAFSFLHNVSWGQTFFKVLTSISLILFVALLVYYLFINKKNYIVAPISLSLIIGGTIGNFIDRLAFSKVRDFIGFTFGNYNFPIFNLADTFLVVGVILFIFHLLFLDESAVFKKNEGKWKK